MPTPTPAAVGEKYKSFQDTYRDAPTDEHVPSLQNKDAAKIVLPTPPFSCISQYGRRVLFCTDCGKPRIIYSRKKLTESQQLAIDTYLEVFEFICGRPLFPEGHSLEEVLYQPKQTRCRAPISSQYYRAANVIAMPGWKWVCAVDGCHDASEAAIEDDGYSCLPRCALCKEGGKEAPKARSNVRSNARSGTTVATIAPEPVGDGGANVSTCTSVDAVGEEETAQASAATSDGATRSTRGDGGDVLEGAEEIAAPVVLDPTANLSVVRTIRTGGRRASSLRSPADFVGDIGVSVGTRSRSRSQGKTGSRRRAKMPQRYRDSDDEDEGLSVGGPKRMKRRRRG